MEEKAFQNLMNGFRSMIMILRGNEDKLIDPEMAKFHLLHDFGSFLAESALNLSLLEVNKVKHLFDLEMRSTFGEITDGDKIHLITILETLLIVGDGFTSVIRPLAQRQAAIEHSKRENQEPE